MAFFIGSDRIGSELMNYEAGESPYLSYDALSLYRQNAGLIHRYVVSI